MFQNETLFSRLFYRDVGADNDLSEVAIIYDIIDLSLDACEARSRT